MKFYKNARNKVLSCGRRSPLYQTKRLYYTFIIFMQHFLRRDLAVVHYFYIYIINFTTTHRKKNPSYYTPNNLLDIFVVNHFSHFRYIIRTNIYLPIVNSLFYYQYLIIIHRLMFIIIIMKYLINIIIFQNMNE